MSRNEIQSYFGISFITQLSGMHRSIEMKERHEKGEGFRFYFLLWACLFVLSKGVASLLPLQKVLFLGKRAFLTRVYACFGGCVSPCVFMLCVHARGLVWRPWFRFRFRLLTFPFESRMSDKDVEFP